jgi:hypothetical protein
MSITDPSFIVALQSVVRQRSKETYEKKTIAKAIISKAATQTNVKAPVRSPGTQSASYLPLSPPSFGHGPHGRIARLNMSAAACACVSAASQAIALYTGLLGDPPHG